MSMDAREAERICGERNRKGESMRKKKMQFIAQIQKSENADLTLDWKPVNGSDYADAAMTFLKKNFGELASRGFAWVAVAKENGPKHDTGMPMVFHSFRLEWEKPLPS